MKLRLTKQIIGAFAVLAVVTSSGSLLAAEADGSYIVSSQVVSDGVSPPGGYVGDLESETINLGCINEDGGASGSCGDLNADGSRRGNGGGLLGGCKDLLNNQAGCQPKKYDRPDLFYNFYSQGNCNTANAQMYISPVPVPAFVGHTFNTYQPLYPHEFMYWHKNRFHNNYDNGRGMNRTKVKYYAPPIKTAISNIYWNKLRLPR
jgi:hypothetical protein